MKPSKGQALNPRKAETAAARCEERVFPEPGWVPFRPVLVSFWGCLWAARGPHRRQKLRIFALCAMGFGVLFCCTRSLLEHFCGHFQATSEIVSFKTQDSLALLLGRPWATSTTNLAKILRFRTGCIGCVERLQRMIQRIHKVALH